MRFNSDSQKLEYFNGDVWMQVHTLNPDLNGGVRGLHGGGAATNINTIQYITISTQGNATDFGDFPQRQYLTAATSSRTRGVWMGGYTNSPSSTYINSIQAVEMLSTGNGFDFGDLTQTSGYNGITGNQTRAIRLGGTAPVNPSTNVMDYVTITNQANAVDFGDCSAGGAQSPNINSPTRGVFAVAYGSQIDYVTIPTLGNAQDFGTLQTGATESPRGACNAVRGILGGGYTSSSISNIQFVTIATKGNTTNFGDLTAAMRASAGTSSPTRAVWFGGLAPSGVNTIQYVTIATTGDAVDFGDCVDAVYEGGACSTGHGGLG
jgi:hypothetical protein